MKYIDSWLTGLGLEYIVPKLKANGITTPKKLAALRFIILFYINLFLVININVIFMIIFLATTTTNFIFLMTAGR
jgi:hypothetical protein